jgi:uncharacterized protein YyaL (SSP411 family)
MNSRFLRTLLLASGAAFIGLPAFAAAPASSSLFLHDQGETAVKWMPWGEAAFERARAEKKPIYLHIGSFTNELSRAMARQSFSNAEAAKFLNDNFVCVIVDRDEQPELAALYRAYVHTVKQMDGWPINVWLTPELKPFEGATYLPPSEEWGKPGLMNVTKQVAGAWQNDPAAQRQKAADAVAALQAAEKLAAPAAVTAAALRPVIGENVDAWKAKFDATNGGFGDPPKRLEPELLRCLLLDPATRDLALATLRAMADGAIRDQLDGGFFRQATDVAWRQPYFQKTAADQARIALTYLDAAKLDSDPRFTAAARGALQYVLDQLGDGTHGFAAAQDASGDAIASFLWTVDDFRSALGEKDGDGFAKALGVVENGNVPEDAYTGVTVTKKNVLYRAVAYTPATDAAEAKLRAKLLQVRSQRPAPRTDSAVMAGVQGLLLSAFARAGAELNEPRFRATAQQLAGFVREQLKSKDGTLRRIAGRPFAAAPDDYTFVIEGLRAYGAGAKDAAATKAAADLQALLDQNFFDATTGRYFASTGTSDTLWARVHVPAPSAGELPAPESVVLTLAPAGDANAPKVAAALAVEVRDSAEAPRGDLLLALKSFATAK